MLPSLGKKNQSKLQFWQQEWLHYNDRAQPESQNIAVFFYCNVHTKEYLYIFFYISDKIICNAHRHIHTYIWQREKSREREWEKEYCQLLRSGQSLTTNDKRLLLYQSCSSEWVVTEYVLSLPHFFLKIVWINWNICLFVFNFKKWVLCL